MPHARRRSAASRRPAASLPGSRIAGAGAVPDAAAVDRRGDLALHRRAVEHARRRGRSGASSSALLLEPRPPRGGSSATPARRSPRSRSRSPWRSRSACRPGEVLEAEPLERVASRPAKRASAVGDAVGERGDREAAVAPAGAEAARSRPRARRRRAPGRRALACSAAHSPVKPPPTMHRSASVRARARGAASRRAAARRARTSAARRRRRRRDGPRSAGLTATER